MKKKEEDRFQKGEKKNEEKRFHNYLSSNNDNNDNDNDEQSLDFGWLAKRELSLYVAFFLEFLSNFLFCFVHFLFLKSVRCVVLRSRTWRYRKLW